MLTGFIEVERALENLIKSGKMFGMPGGRREFQPPYPPGPARFYPKLGEYTHLSSATGWVSNHQ